MSELGGRTALVTGAGRGIGRAVALDLAQRGAAVALAGRTAAGLRAVRDEIVAAGGRACDVEADIADERSVARLVRRVADDVGPVDVLCANSGVTGPTALLWDVSAEDWLSTFAVNVFGTFLCCRAVLPGMIERNCGVIVIIGSISGKRPLPRRSPYAASKMALVGMTRTLAMEAGAYGVRVNLVSPGPVDGPRLDGVIADQAAAQSVPADQIRERMVGESALPRFVAPEEVARAVGFLASDAASAITGQDITVAAGTVMY